jgi:hypothetical protein
LDARVTTLLCKKKIIVPKSGEMRLGCDLAECSKERCSSKRDVLPVVVVISLDYSRRQNGTLEVVGNFKSFTTENCRVITLAALIVVSALEKSINISCNICMWDRAMVIAYPWFYIIKRTTFHIR